MSKQVIFWGTPEFALPPLKVLNQLKLVKAVVSQPDKEKGRGKKIELGPVSKYATENNLPLIQPTKLDEDLISQLKSYLPATFVIVAYGKIIPKKILDLSELTPLNIHPSLLPELRGPSPLQTALLEGLTESGVSLMQVDEEMDHGPIAAQEKLTISDNDYLPDFSKKAALMGAQLLKDNILNYLDSKLEPQEQYHSKATFTKMIEKEDGQIDWQDSAVNIRNKIRAFTPWPSAYFFAVNKRVKVLKTDISDNRLEPGKFEFKNNQLLVGTKDRSLVLIEVQPEGKAQMSGESFWNGYSKLLK